MTKEHRYTNRCRVNQNGVVTHDFLGFPGHFHFFFGVIVVHKDIDLRDRIKSDLAAEGFWRDFTRAQQIGCLLSQLFHSRFTRTRNRLISTYINALNANSVLDWL